MFSLEKDLVNTFTTHLLNEIHGLSITSYSSEFNYQNGKTDIIAKNKRNEIIAFEAKLHNIKKVINQAYRNTSFANYSYIILPATKYELQKKYFAEIEKMNIGVILVDDSHSWIEVKAETNHPILPWLTEKATTILTNKECAACQEASF